MSYSLDAFNLDPGAEPSRPPHTDLSAEEEPAVADIDVSHWSDNELSAIRQQYCPVGRLQELSKRRRLTEQDLAEVAVSVNISRVYTFECPVKGCNVICSARAENQRLKLTRDEIANCLVDRLRQVRANQ